MGQKYFSIKNFKDLIIFSKEIENLEFVQHVNFKFMNLSMRWKKDRKHLSIFYPSREENFIVKVLFDNLAKKGHRRLTSLHVTYNLFKESILVRDIKLQNTHIFLFKTPREVMQVSSLNAQLGLESELVDWYREPTSA